MGSLKNLFNKSKGINKEYEPARPEISNPSASMHITDFNKLIDELVTQRGYGWVRPEGIRRELEKMTSKYKD